MYSYREVLDFVEQEDVKFIRLAYFDVFGQQKNISIMPAELERAFQDGVSFDASAVPGYGDEAHSDLFLHPDPSTISILPWRPSTGRVVRMYCDICDENGSPFAPDPRRILKEAVSYADSRGYAVNFGPEMEFYLFKTDEAGEPTKEPFDRAGYMGISPEDRGEDIRREVCFTLLEMGITPEASHHEEGPGQNEIDFRYSAPLAAADNTSTFKWVVKTLAMLNGAWASFMPKPLPEAPGSGMHVNISLTAKDGRDRSEAFLAGILDHIREMTLFLNPCRESYARLGGQKAPKYVSWAPENRSQLVRIPAVKGRSRRMELRSPDPQANPYLVFALLIYAGLDGIDRGLSLPGPADFNVYTAPKELTDRLEPLPATLEEAQAAAKDSVFLRKHLPETYFDTYCRI